MSKRNNIRSSGCDYELGDIVGHNENQATSVSSGLFLWGVIICEEIALFYGGRRCPAGCVVEKVKYMKTVLYRFLPTRQTTQR